MTKPEHDPAVSPPLPPQPATAPEALSPGTSLAMPAVANLEFKAVLLLTFMVFLVVGSALYVLYARGAFESTQKLVLVSDDSEGVVVGMDLTFSGFPIGRVRRIELGDDGKARIVVDVPTKDAHWLRTSSVFTQVRGLVGSTNIRAYTGILKDPPLPDGAVREVLRGDAGAEVPKLVAAAKDLIENLNNLTASEGAIGTSLGNLQKLTARLNGPGGALSVLLGNDAEAKKLIATLHRSNALLPAPQRAVAAGGDVAALKGIADPLSQLVAAGVMFRAGRASPAVLQQAVDTASSQGWRRPLLAWLGVQLQLAEKRGDAAVAAQLRRRITLTETPATAPPTTPPTKPVPAAAPGSKP